VDKRNNVEKFVLIIFSIYSLGMLGVSLKNRWEGWISIFLFANLVMAWTIHLKQYKNLKFRAIMTTITIVITVNLYAGRAENFTEVCISYVVLIILVGLYGIKEVVGITVISTLFMYFCQIFILNNISVNSIKEIINILPIFIDIILAQFLVYFWVSKRNESYQKLLETISGLKRAEQSKDDFLANVSHEIRTPINTICGVSEMILREDNLDNIKDEVLNIQTEGKNLMSLVSDILDFSELQSGNMDIVEENYNISSTINDIVSMAVAKKGKKNVELIIDCDAYIPCSLVGDEKKIRRAIMNLVYNAIKFTNEGGITIGISGRREEYGINLCVTVKDTGIGMDDESLEKLFSSFNQVDSKRNRHTDGVGLGLAISQAIVQKMGGFISVKSKLGKGSEFKIVIPQKIYDERAIVHVKNSEALNVAVYIEIEKFTMEEIRDEYVNNIKHMIKQLNVKCHICRNVGELKHRVQNENFTHIFISTVEYSKNREFFDNLSDKTKIVIIIERDEEKEITNRTVTLINKPLFILSVVSVLNNDEKMYNEKDIIQKEHFIAPTANILVVDDNMMNIHIMEGLLKPYQIKVTTANSGRQALEKIDDKSYDLVFMDHMMPEMDGVETLHKIREKSGNYYKKVPIVALTANAIAGAREMLLSKGFDDFLEKPVEISVLERVLKRNLPEKKICYIEENMEEKVEEKKAAMDYEYSNQNSYEDSGFKVGNLNTEKALLYCGGKKNYFNILGICVKSAESEQNKLQDAFEREDWKDYTIKIHALKSSMMTIGEENLSELAKRLESAGKQGDIDFIKNNHNSMIGKYRNVIEMIRSSEIFSKLEIELTQEKSTEMGGITVTKEEAIEMGEVDLTKEEIIKYIENFEEAVYQLDKDKMMGIISKLQMCRYKGETLREHLEIVKRKVKMSDYMSALETLKKIKK
jgi:signal transduction histidine kinase/DNA-binding response OmpR family regulator/HPt (histidine-containing phosphotransfer) domain-containing protein